MSKQPPTPPAPRFGPSALVAGVVGLALGALGAWFLAPDATIAQQQAEQIETLEQQLEQARALAEAEPVCSSQALGVLCPRLMGAKQAEEGEVSGEPDIVLVDEDLAEAVEELIEKRRVQVFAREQRAVASNQLLDSVERAMRVSRSGGRIRPAERREINHNYRSAIDKAPPDLKDALTEVYQLQQRERADPDTVSDEEWELAKKEVERQIATQR